MAQLVREGLDRHDPARPPRGRRTGARAAGAEQTSAAKTQAGSARGATSAAKQEASSDSAAPSAAKASAQTLGQPKEPGDEAASPLKADRRPDRPDTSAVKPADETTSAAKTRRLGRQVATARAKPAAPPPPRPQTSAAKASGGTGRAIPAAVKREGWRRDRAAAATWTAPAGVAAARNICCRSITSCRMPAAAPLSRTISDCCAPRITATATPAPDSAAAPARIVNLRSDQSMALKMDAAIVAPR